MTAYVSNAKHRFPLGIVVSTPGALAMLSESNQDAREYLDRHVSGDWGNCCPEDMAANESALINGGRIVSVYRTNGGKLWIITEADRSSTCLLLPEEY